MRHISYRREYGAVVLALGMGMAALTGCAAVNEVQQTFELRDVQQQFSQAVIADNNAVIDPFIAGTSEALFGRVIDALDDQRIDDLDPRLQANAWMMRAVSAWRTGRAAEALAWAERGLASPGLVAQSRDHILLVLIPALVIDTDLRQRLTSDGRRVRAESYDAPDGYRANFETAMRTVESARSLVGVATPATTVDYLNYQAWRVLTNWRYVVSTLDTREARAAAGEAAKLFLRSDGLDASASAAAAAIPDDSPLRQRIGEQGGAR